MQVYSPGVATTYLELELHGSLLMIQRSQQLSHVTAQIARQDLRVAGRYGFQHGVVNEDVLVLSLHHVVPLSTQARHLTIDIDRVHVFDPLQHSVDHNESSRPPHASTAYINSTSSN